MSTLKENHTAQTTDRKGERFAKLSNEKSRIERELNNILNPDCEDWFAQKQVQRDEAAVCPPVAGEPDVVAAARAVLKGEMPPWWAGPYRPDFSDSDQRILDVYLHPALAAEDTGVEYLGSVGSLRMEEAVRGGDPAAIKRLLLGAIGEALTALRTHANAERVPERIFSNSRLNARVALACHQELEALLAAYEAL